MRPDQSPQPFLRSRRFLFSTGILTFLLLTFGSLWRHHPALPPELTLHVKFPIGIPRQVEPLIVGGVRGAADFLLVRYVDATTVRIGYDHWGVGGPDSPTITVQPGATHVLKVKMPSLANLESSGGHHLAPLRVEFDGREILRADVPFYSREPTQIYFADTPVGGSIARVFRGEILTTAGRKLHGRPHAFFSWGHRLRHWVETKLAQLPVIALVSLVLAFGLQKLAVWGLSIRLPRQEDPTIEGHAQRPLPWLLLTLGVCAFAFSYVVTGGTFRFFVQESFTNFYDYQARSLLRGQLDVPAEALSGEAFIFEGKCYGYFGPTPALLRMPFVILNLGFGQLSRSAMLVYYLASLVAVYALLVYAARMLSGRKTWPSSSDVVLLVGSVGLGSTFFFLGSRAYIYHEAILCGCAFALWSGYASLRYLAEPHLRWWLVSLLCGVLSVHARPPVGLFALCFLGAAALFHCVKVLVKARASAGSATSSPNISFSALRAPLLVAVLAGCGVLSFNALSYLKFKSFEGAPLRYHVQYTPERLAKIESRNFHLSNLHYNFDNYLWRPNFAFLSEFPYFGIAGRDPAEYAGAKFDLAEHALPLPYAMPPIFFLALVGGGYAALRWPQSRLPLGILALGTLPMVLALFAAIAISHRYTADFCPPLIIAATFGLTALEICPLGWRRPVRVLLALLTVSSIFITLAITLHYQGERVWGVSDDVKQRYQTLKTTIDGFFHPPRS